MRRAPLLLLAALLLAVRATDAATRIVVTLREYSACEAGAAVFSVGNNGTAGMLVDSNETAETLVDYNETAASCASVAKCYGRRLVLNVAGCPEAGDWAEWARDALADANCTVAMVEEDSVFSVSGAANDGNSSGPADQPGLNSSDAGDTEILEDPAADLNSSDVSDTGVAEAPAADLNASTVGDTDIVEAPAANLNASTVGDTDIVEAPAANLNASTVGDTDIVEAPAANLNTSTAGNADTMEDPAADLNTSTAGNADTMEAPAADLNTSNPGNTDNPEAPNAPTVHTADDAGAAAAGALDQWNLRAIDIYKLWEQYGTRGANYTVAVLDSGVAASALAAFGARIVPGYDFVSDEALAKDGDARDSDYYDPGDADAEACPGASDSWHGTKVASVLAANYSGFLGVAPEVSVLPVRVLGRCGTGFASDVADGIVWAAGGSIIGLESATVETEGRIIVMALSGKGRCPSFVQTAVDLAVARGAKLFAAAGNDPSLQASDHFPANCNGVISVGALNANRQVASYSSRGADVYMPGGDFDKGVPCLGADLTSVQSCVGTSIAVPHAVGVGAVAQTFVDGFMLKADLTTGENSSSPYVQGTGCTPGQYVGAGTSATRPSSAMSSCSASIGGYTYRVKSHSQATNYPVHRLFDKQSSGAIYSWTSASNFVIATGESLSSNPYFNNDADFKGTYIVIDMGASFILKSYSIRGMLNVETRVPKKWRIYGTNDDSCWTVDTCCDAYTASCSAVVTGLPTTWSLLDDQNLQPVTGTATAGQYSSGSSPTVFSLKNTIPTRYIAMQINAMGIAFDAATIGEWYITGGYATCVSCPAGTFSATPDSATCTPCLAGTYSATTGATSNTSCTLCPAGTYSTATGATSSASCAPCLAGTYSATTGATSNTSCTLCPAGTYSTATGATSSASCAPCPAGTFSAAPGASACQQCGSGLTSAPGSAACGCAAGLYGSIGPQSIFPATGLAATDCSRVIEGYTYRVRTSSYYPNQQPARAFDKETEWSSYISGSGTFVSAVASLTSPYFTTHSTYRGQYIVIDMGESFIIKQYAFTSTVNYLAQLPFKWRIYGTEDTSIWTAAGSDCFLNVDTTKEWFLLDDRAMSSYESGTSFYIADNTVRSRFIALHVNSVRTAVFDFMILGDWKIYGSYIICLNCPAGTYSATIGATSNATCQRCPAGSFSAAGSANCTLCAAGFFAAAPGSASCTPCPAGTYSTASGATSSASCLACPAGSYAGPNSTSCTPCPGGTFSTAAGGANASACSGVCPPGSFSSPGSTSCAPCPVGTYAAAAGAAACTQCPNSTVTYTSGATQLSQCVPGKITSMPRKELMYPAGNLGNGLCATSFTLSGTSYGTGTYNWAVSSASEGCSGSYHPSKVWTSTSTFEYNGGLWGENQYSSGVYAKGTQDFLLPGYYGDWIWLQLPPGSYVLRKILIRNTNPLSFAPKNYSVYGRAGSTGTWTTLMVVTNAESNATFFHESPISSSTQAYDTFGIVVNALTYPNTFLGIRRLWFIVDGGTAPCAAGSYALDTYSCIECPQGTYSAVVGATNISQCTACAVGSYSQATGATTASNCTLCPAGTFSGTAGATSQAACTNCPAGYFSAAGSPECSACPPGSYSATPGATSCPLCPAGTYAWAGGTAVCTQCPSSTWTQLPGATQPSQCMPVVSNRVQVSIPPESLGCDGTGNEKTVTVTGASFGNGVYEINWSNKGSGYSPRCVFDKNRDTVGVWGWNYDLGSGGYTATPAQDLANDGSQGDWITLKVPFNFEFAGAILDFAGYAISNQVSDYKVYARNDAMSNWNPVATVTWAAYTGGVHTFVADAGNVMYNSFGIEVLELRGASVGQSVITNLKPVEMAILGKIIFPCPAGTFQITSALCMQCPTGTSSSAVNATSNATCISCPSGTFANTPGMSNCTFCPAGTANNATGATSNASCQPCQPGSFSAPGSTNCTLCAAGFFAAAPGSASCEPCPTGTFSAARGAQLCLGCPAGSFSFGASAACTLCPAGTWSNASAAPFCTPCPAGSFLNTTGATSQAACAACPPGTFGNSTGLTKCLACSAGRYAAGAGATACALCPKGTSTKKV